MVSNNKIPEISKQVYENDVFTSLEKNYSSIGPQWISCQMDWLTSIYSAFKDHDKYLIIICLIKKTLDFYTRNFIRISYENFYSKDTVEIEKFNIMDISKNLGIPKESARRKIVELEKSSVLQRSKKKIIIDRSAFPFVKPISSIKRISRFLSLFSKILHQEKILSKEFSSIELEKVIKDNFSYIWQIYYELQIPMITTSKFFFGDIETFHIFSACVVNQHLSMQNINEKKMSRAEFFESMKSDFRMKGINAMSISDITSIPRATVVRKLKKLVQSKHLIIDKNKHYKVEDPFLKTLLPQQKINLRRLSNFSTKIYNIAIL